MSQQGALTRLSLKLLWRDWKGGELNILIAALLIAVTTVTGISIFADRISRSIMDEAGVLLAADAQIAGTQPIQEQWVLDAQAAGLQTAFITSFQAMAFGPDMSSQLSAVKAVSETYPLKGQMEISRTLFGDLIKTTEVPRPGEAWVSSRVLATLAMEVGDVIGVGDADLLVTAVLLTEPDSAGSNFGFNPRILINEADIPATGAVQLGSRVNYALLLAGDVEPFKQRWLPNQGVHHRWRDVADADQNVTETLARAESFLLLAGALGVVLAGVALALASKRYAKRQLNHVALLKTLGLTPKKITRLYAGNLFVLGTLMVISGLFLGWFLHWIFLELFEGLLPRELQPSSLKPYMIGIVTGLLALMAFAMPPVFMLRQTPPSRVLRSDIAGGTLTQGRTMALGALAIIALVYFYSNSWLITAVMLMAGLLSALGVSFLAWLLIIVVKRVGSRFGTTWRLGLASLQRHGNQNSFQIMIFSMSLMLLFLLVLMRTSLLSEWQQQLPEGTPNHFAFNIFEGERESIDLLLADNNVTSTPFYPMVRGRLVEVEGEAIAERLARLQPDGDDLRRELNITWSDQLADDNEVVKGNWFQPGDDQQSLISVEADFARSLQVDLGDELTFSFGGQLVSAKVHNIRTVKWESLAPNFYVIFSGPILEGAGAAYLTSFYLAADQKNVLVDILRQYPTITVIEVDAIINQIQGIVSQVTVAIEFILGLVLVAGIVVLIASVQATLDSRLQESAILRTIGAQAKMVRGALAIEFLVLGFLAGILAVIGAETALFFLQTRLLNIEFAPHVALWFIGPVIGALLIGLVGMQSTRKVVKVAPMAVLRQI